MGHHDLSHHGQDPEKIEQLTVLEIEKLKTLRTFLGQLRDSQEEGASLLDRVQLPERSARHSCTMPP